MDEKEKQHKLKELERTLAEELGPSAGPKASETVELGTTTSQNETAVQTGEPSSASVKTETTGATTSKAETVAASTEPEPGLSVADFDALLNESDPGFESEMKDLQAGVKESSASIDLKAIDIAAMIQDDEPPVIQTSAPEKKVETSRQSQLIKKILALIKSTVAWPISLLRAIKDKGVKGTVSAFKEGLPALKVKVIKEGSEWIAEIKLAIANLKKVKAKSFFVFFLLLVTVGALVAFIKVVLSGGGLPLPKPEYFMSSFDGVATKITKYDTAKELEDFDSPLRHPEHVVLLKKQVVNLKASASSTHRPFAAFEIFVEAGTQEVAIEVKEREKELLDLASRVAESIPYDDFAAQVGKEKFKVAVRREFNKVLNTGRVKKIYFKTVFYNR